MINKKKFSFQLLSSEKLHQVNFSVSNFLIFFTVFAVSFIAINYSLTQKFSDEYYKEIDKRIRLEFPHKFGKTKVEQTSKPTQNVASATRSSKTGRKSVRLTSSQVAIAKKLGVPLEEYAKQLMNTKEV